MINKYNLLTTSPCLNRYFNDLGNLFFFIFIIILSLIILRSFLLKFAKENDKNILLFNKINISSYEPKILYFIFFYHLAFTIINVFFADCDEMTSLFPVMPNDANSLFINAGYYFSEIRFTLGSNAFSYILYPFVSLLKVSFLNINLFFSFLGFFGMLFFYSITKKYIYKYNSNLFLFLIFLILLPNFHYWTSYLTKEALIFSFLSFYLFYIFSEEENYKIKIILLIFFVLCSSVRPYFGLVFIISHLLAFFYVKVIQKEFNFKILSIFLIVFFATYYIFVNIYWKTGYQEVGGIIDIPSNLFYFMDQRFRTTMIGYSFNEHFDYISHFLYFYFAPLHFPTDFNLRKLVVFLNNFTLLLIFLILVMHIIYNYKYFNRAFGLIFKNQNKKTFRIGLLFFLILFTFLLSNSVANFGIIMRQKETIMFIMYFYLICINSNIIYIKGK